MRPRPVAIVVAIGLLVLPSAGLTRDKSEPAAAKGSPGDWFPQNSYPAEAKRKGEQGRVSVRLKVDKSGMPIGCEVIGSSGSAALDMATCQLALANGRFRPAADARGAPVESMFTLPGVRWELRGNPPRKLEGPWRAAATIKIDQTGNPLSCTEQQSGPVPDEIQMCLAAMRMPAEFGLFARGGSTAKLSELVVEASFGLDGASPPPMIYDAAGRETVKMAVIRYQVDPDGTARNCEIDAQSGPNPDNLCADPPGPFLPIDKPRGIVVTFALSRPAAK